MSNSDNIETIRQDGNFFNSYLEHTKVLRTWFVAYGIGGPAIILTQKDAWEALARSNCAKPIILLFLSGVLFQIVLTYINKTTMWIVYFGSAKPSFMESTIYKKADKMSERFYIDFLLDTMTIIVFFVSTLLMFSTLASSKPIEIPKQQSPAIVNNFYYFVSDSSAKNMRKQILPDSTNRKSK